MLSKTYFSTKIFKNTFILAILLNEHACIFTASNFYRLMLSVNPYVTL